MQRSDIWTASRPVDVTTAVAVSAFGKFAHHPVGVACVWRSRVIDAVNIEALSSHQPSTKLQATSARASLPEPERSSRDRATRRPRLNPSERRIGPKQSRETAIPISEAPAAILAGSKL